MMDRAVSLAHFDCGQADGGEGRLAVFGPFEIIEPHDREGTWNIDSLPCRLEQNAERQDVGRREDGGRPGRSTKEVEGDAAAAGDIEVGLVKRDHRSLAAGRFDAAPPKLRSDRYWQAARG